MDKRKEVRKKKQKEISTKPKEDIIITRILIYLLSLDWTLENIMQFYLDLNFQNVQGNSISNMGPRAGKSFCDFTTWAWKHFGKPSSVISVPSQMRVDSQPYCNRCVWIQLQHKRTRFVDVNCFNFRFRHSSKVSMAGFESGSPVWQAGR